MKAQILKKIPSIITFFIFSLFLCFCASRKNTPLPYPDLAFISVTQRPSPVLAGRSAKLDIELTNQGEIQAPATIISLRDESNTTIYNMNIPSLYPGVTITLSMVLPSIHKSSNFRLLLDPGMRIYETNRLNNTIVVGVSVADIQQMKILDKKSEDEFSEALKLNNAEYCREKIKINALQRLERTMNYESALSGEMVKFSAEIENTCDREVYDITLRWTAVKTDDLSSSESIFGQVKIDHILPGEKDFLYRSFRPSTGRWEVRLKVIFENLQPENEVYLKPSFILIVNPKD